MKKNAFIVIAALSVIACNTMPQTDKVAERERDSLQIMVNQRDSKIREFLASFVDIEHTLDSINVKQKNIYLKTEKPSDVKAGVVADINREITAINSLMEKNRKKISDLNSQLKNSGGKNKELEDAIKTLNQQLSQKQQELVEMNSKLNVLNAEIMQLQAYVGFLSIENATQADMIASSTADLHKAFYIIGTSKDLEKEKIIDKKGGLLGIGKTKELSNDFDATKFTQIDYTQLISIEINSKKAEIITTHPTSSYRLEKDKDVVKKLIILNAVDFWSASKYLVIIKG
jgi:peptidoglycan hydrolase CwlO-like protein